MPNPPSKLDRKSALIAAILLAGGALAADKLFLGGGSPESAEAADLLIAPNEESQDLWSDQSVASLVPQIDLASQLESASKRLGLTGKDFPEGFKDLQLASRSLTSTTEGAPTSGRVLFHDSHTLGGVMLGESDSLAIVNGETLRIGDSIDGYTLVEVGKGEARFSDGRLSVWLRVERPGTSPIR